MNATMYNIEETVVTSSDLSLPDIPRIRSEKATKILPTPST